MKSLLIVLGITLICITSHAQSTGTFTDPRDGKVYQTIKVGYQWVMNENLAYKPSKGRFWAYKRDRSNVDTHGYLYNWKTANQIAPEGWHLPSSSEWEYLYESLGGTINKIKASNFNPEKSGVRNLFGFTGLNKIDTYWSSTYRTNFIVYSESYVGQSPDAFFYVAPKNAGCGVRLFKDLDEYEVYSYFKSKGTRSGYRSFLELFPQGSYSDSVKLIFERIYAQRTENLSKIAVGMSPDQVISLLGFEEELNPKTMGGILIGIGLLSKGDRKNTYNGLAVLDGYSFTFADGQLTDWNIIDEELRTGKFYGESVNSQTGMEIKSSWSVDSSK